MSKAKRRASWFPLALGSLVFLVIIAYSLYWVILSGELKKGVEDWAEDQRRAGMTVEYADMTMSGFPFRFVLTTTDPVMGSDRDGWQWAGEELKLVAQSYNLYHVLAFAPGSSEISLPDGQVITALPDDKSKASFRFSKDWKLKQVGLSVPSLEARQSGEVIAQIEALDLGLRPMPDNASNLQFALSAERASVTDLPEDIAWLGTDLDHFVLWVEMENFYPLAEGELSETEWRVDGNKIHVRRGEIAWGPLEAAARASVSVTRDNDVNGTVGVHLKNADALKQALDEAGLLTDEIRSGISTLALMSQNDNFATVQLKDRGIYLLGNKLGEY